MTERNGERRATPPDEEDTAVPPFGGPGAPAVFVLIV